MIKKNNGEYGGANRDRTDDLLRARQALSQLSYSPIKNILGTVNNLYGNINLYSLDNI